MDFTHMHLHFIYKCFYIYTKVCAATIKEVLDHLPGAPRTRIGIITYDSAVHFYNLKAGLKSPQMMIVPDIQELFIPIPDELLVNLRYDYYRRRS
jgi:protein transport protein SEC24